MNHSHCILYPEYSENKSTAYFLQREICTIICAVANCKSMRLEKGAAVNKVLLGVYREMKMDVVMNFIAAYLRLQFLKRACCSLSVA